MCGCRTYIATASRIIRPGVVYRVSVAVLPESADLFVKSIITKGKHEIASAQEVMESGSSHHLLMKIPPSITAGEYRLKLIGYSTSMSHKVLFKKESPLTFHPDFLSILVQSNRKVYRNEMKGI